MTVSPEDPTAVIADGQIDSCTAPMLDEVLADLPIDGAVSVDLSKVTFVDSSGLRVLVRAHRRHHAGGGLVVVSPSEPVSRLLDITGLRSEFQISP